MDEINIIFEELKKLEEFNVKVTKERRLIEIFENDVCVKSFEVEEKETVEEFMAALEEASFLIVEDVKEIKEDLDEVTIFEVSKL